MYVAPDEVVDAYSEVVRAREAAARARSEAMRAPTSDQLSFRRSLAERSRKTPSKYTPTIGRRSTALYRLSNVSGQHPQEIDYGTLAQ